MAYKHFVGVTPRVRARRLGRVARLAAGAALLSAAALSSAQAQIVDIRSFGARCDGSDDSGALGAAFSSLPNGGTLQISCQIGVSEAILRDKTAVTVEGVSGGGLIGVGSNPANILVRVENCSGCTVRNLTINANYVGAAGLSVSWSSNTAVENNTIFNVAYPAEAALVTMGNRGNRYVGNSVTRTSGTGGDGARGMWIGNGAAGSPSIEWSPLVANNTVRDIAATGIVGHAVNATFTGNTVEGTAGAGIKLVPPNGAGGQTLIQNNTLRNNRFHGVQIEGADSAVVVQNNNLSDNADSGVYASGGSFANGRIAGNTISNNRGAGIYLYDGRNVAVEDNRISGGGNGIVLEAIPSSAMQGLQLGRNNITGVVGDGIALWGRGGWINGLAVNGNSIQNNGRYGMSLEEQNVGSISGVSLNGNCFSSNGAGALLDLRVVNTLSAQQGACGAAPAPGPVASYTPVASPATVSTASQTASWAIRVNAGGGQYTDAGGNVWSADFGSPQGELYRAPNAIRGTSAQELYQTTRWWHETMEYGFDVPAGTRTVTLKFAEPYFDSPGQRVFDVVINGQTVLAGFDIVAQAGGAYAAIDRAFQVQSGGRIEIRMQGRVDDPVISAIEIR